MGKRDRALIVQMGNTGHGNDTIRSTAGPEEVTTKWQKALKSAFTKYSLKSHVESKTKPKICPSTEPSKALLYHMLILTNSVTFSQAI
jgi:hypothetical protein